MLTAVVDGALRVTYCDLAADLARCVHWLEQAGLTPDMLVAVEILRDRYVHLLLLLACEILGASTTPLISGTSIDTDPDFFRGAKFCCAVNGAPKRLSAGRLSFRTTCFSGCERRQYRRGTEPACRRNSRQIVCRIIRTSGTTARPGHRPDTRDAGSDRCDGHGQYDLPGVSSAGWLGAAAIWRRRKANSGTTICLPIATPFAALFAPRTAPGQLSIDVPEIQRRGSRRDRRQMKRNDRAGSQRATSMSGVNLQPVEHRRAHASRNTSPATHHRQRRSVADRRARL